MASCICDVASVKSRYTAGTRVVMEYMNDERPILSGEIGTVKCVDDIGTIHVLWDSGRYLGICPGEDRFHILENHAGDREGMVEA